MPKRKITDHFRSTKRAKTVASMPARRTAKRYVARKPKRTKRVSLRRKRVAKRRPARRRTRLSAPKGTAGNKKVYLFETLDSVTVPPPTVAQDTVDTFGQKCAYLSPGISALTTLNLGGLKHINIIANDVRATDGYSAAVSMGQTKFMLQGIQEYSLINQSNSIANVEMYTCTCIRDCIAGTTTNTINQLLGQGFYQRGFGNGNSVGVNPNQGGNEGLYDALLTPFQSTKFMAYFRISSTNRFSMDPGMTKNVKLSIRNKMINYNHYETFVMLAPQIAQESINIDYVHRAGEVFYLFKITGTPADLTSNKNEYTYTCPKVNMICKTRYNYYAINRQQPVINKGQPQGFNTLNTGTDSAQIINDDSGNQESVKTV
ncbi:capsid protein [Sichuan tick-associated circovirus 1]|nr:capsid protein [Sichuan tick-associated circovirus 1]